MSSTIRMDSTIASNLRAQHAVAKRARYDSTALADAQTTHSALLLPAATTTSKFGLAAACRARQRSLVPVGSVRSLNGIDNSLENVKARFREAFLAVSDPAVRKRLAADPSFRIVVTDREQLVRIAALMGVVLGRVRATEALLYANGGSSDSANFSALRLIHWFCKVIP